MPQEVRLKIQPYKFSPEELEIVALSFTDEQLQYIQTKAWETLHQLAASKRGVNSNGVDPASLQQEAFLSGRLEAFFELLGVTWDDLLV